MNHTRATVPVPVRRIWSEFVPYETLRSRRVIGMLRSRGLQLLVAVTPSTVGELGELIAGYRGEGVELGVWPMVSDSQGRWGSTFNAPVYAEFVLRVVETAGSVTTVAIDLEPPIALLRRIVDANPLVLRGLAKRDTRTSGHAALGTLVQTLVHGGCRCICAVNPVVLGDRPGRSGWQWLLGTPIDEFPFTTVSIMAYTSLIEGYSRGVLSRAVALSLLARTASAAHLRLGTRASLSLGTVGDGALGDEQPYRGVDELAHDVAVARACGVDDLALFDLSGVLQQPQPEEWLDAFVHTIAAADRPPPLWRARLVEQAIYRASELIALCRRGVR